MSSMSPFWRWLRGLSQQRFLRLAPEKLEPLTPQSLHILEADRLSSVDIKALTEDLRHDEGTVKSGGKHVAYKDHLGYWTIGIGRLIDKNRGGGLTNAEANYLLENDIERIINQLDEALPWLKAHPEPVQRALANMTFQMGLSGVLKFKKTLDLLRSYDYEGAANNAMRSKWARQTPKRAQRVTNLIRYANLPI